MFARVVTDAVLSGKGGEVAVALHGLGCGSGWAGCDGVSSPL
jgi:hypothetical protein